MKKVFIAFIFSLFYFSPVQAKEVGCVSTTWRILNNDKVCVEAFKDPVIEGVSCHISYAKTGGVSGAIGFAENPSRFAIACRQIGPLISHKPIANKEENLFNQKMSFLFKDLNVIRMLDKENNTLVYLIISEKLIDGSPYNSISTVPLMPWGDKLPEVEFK